MQMSNILSYLKEFILLGVLLIGLFLIGYLVIYKKIMKGTKVIDKRKMLLYGISIGYLVIVFGATFLTRQNAYKEINLHLFSSYREAWNNMSDLLSKNIILRNIILNILLFVPFGFLLPMYSEKLKKIYKVVPIGIGTTLIIEIVQYVTNMGIFEIDDVFNNTLGVLIGYCIFMIFNNLIKKQNRKYIFAYILPFVFVMGTYISFNVIYQNQEFGNLPSDYTYKINMKDVEVKCNAELSKEESLQNVYYTKVLTEEETRDIAEKLFEKSGTSIDDSRIILYENTAIYYAKDHLHSMWVEYKGGTYRYNTSSQVRLMKESYNSEKNGAKEGQETETPNMEVQELDYTVIKIQGASREEVEEALRNVGIEVPKEAEFKEENGTYIFTADMIQNYNIVEDGDIRCSYYIDKTIDNISNNLVNYEKVKEKELISQEEAYNQILEGKFRYTRQKQEKIKNVIIEDVNLDYIIDTKGYYVPVYIFEAKINNDNDKIIINAIRK